MASRRSGGTLPKTYERQKEQRFESVEEALSWVLPRRERSWNWHLDPELARRWGEAATKQLPDGSYVWRQDPESMRTLARFSGTPESDLRPDFARVEVPFLVARRDSAGGSLLSPVWEELRALNPRATYVSFEGAGHPVILTRPRELAVAMLPFLDDAFAAR